MEGSVALNKDLLHMVQNLMILVPLAVYLSLLGVFVSCTIFRLKLVAFTDTGLGF